MLDAPAQLRESVQKMRESMPLDSRAKNKKRNRLTGNRKHRKNDRVYLERLETRLLLRAGIPHEFGQYDLADPLQDKSTAYISQETVRATSGPVHRLLANPHKSVVGLAPELPGLKLVDPDTSSLAGQVIYLETGGVEDLDYDGPVRVEDVDIPAFQAPASFAGQETAILEDTLLRLNERFSGVGVSFSSVRPQSAPYSTIYVGGDGGQFDAHGSFRGLAEKVDIGNVDRQDFALVFSDNAGFDSDSPESYTGELVDLIAHETGRLLGYANSITTTGSSDSGLFEVASSHATYELDGGEQHGSFSRADRCRPACEAAEILRIVALEFVRELARCIRGQLNYRWHVPPK